MVQSTYLSLWLSLLKLLRRSRVYLSRAYSSSLSSLLDSRSRQDWSDVRSGNKGGSVPGGGGTSDSNAAANFVAISLCASVSKAESVKAAIIFSLKAICLNKKKKKLLKIAYQ